MVITNIGCHIKGGRGGGAVSVGGGEMLRSFFSGAKMST